MQSYHQRKGLEKKSKNLNHLNEAFLERWLPSVNIWYTNCTALGTYVIEYVICIR